MRMKICMNGYFRLQNTSLSRLVSSEEGRVTYIKPGF